MLSVPAGLRKIDAWTFEDDALSEQFFAFHFDAVKGVSGEGTGAPDNTVAGDAFRIAVVGHKLAYCARRILPTSKLGDLPVGGNLAARNTRGSSVDRTRKGGHMARW